MDSCFLVVCNWIILSNEQVNCVHLAQFKVGLWMFFCLRTKLQENWTIAAQARRHPNVKHFSCLYFIVYSKRWEDDIGVVRYLTCFSCYLPLPNWVIQEIPMNLKSIFSFISIDPWLRVHYEQRHYYEGHEVRRSVRGLYELAIIIWTFPFGNRGGRFKSGQQ